MKKKRVFCFLVMLLVFGSIASAEPLEVLNYSFEFNQDGEQVTGWVPDLVGTPQYWTYAIGGEDVNADADTWEDASTDGIVSVAIGATDELYQLLDHKIYPGDEYLLRFDVFYAWSGNIYDGTYQGKLYYDDDGQRPAIAATGGRAIKQTWILDNDLKITVPAGSPATGRKLGIAMITNQADNNWISFDYVRLEMLASPGRAHEPDPANRDYMVPLDKTLTWNTGVDPANLSQPNPAITNHYVYTSTGSATDPNLYPTTTVPAGDPPSATAQFAPADLEREKTYYWRVDEATGTLGPDDPNIIKGMVWSFDTVLTVPMFEKGCPADAAVFEHETVVMTVNAVNPYTMDDSDLIYEWRKVGIPDLLSDTDTLEIVDVLVGDEGDYYCTVTIDVTTFTSDSPAAQLIVKRPIGYWPFDGNMTDVVAGNNGTMIGGGDSYEDGIIDSGEALEFTGDAKETATIPTDAHINLAWTLSWWEKSDDTKTGGTWETMIACGAGTGWEVFDFTRNSTIQYAFGFETNGQQRWISGDYLFTPEDPYLYPRGQWHYLVVAYDPATQDASWYINGVKFTEYCGYDFKSFDEVLYLGNLRDMSQPYAGLIDDLKLYNYTLDAMTIALDYTTVTGTEFCAENPVGDTTGDCVVDINDLLEILDSWLQCNLYPSEMCP